MLINDCQLGKMSFSTLLLPNHSGVRKDQATVKGVSTSCSGKEIQVYIHTDQPDDVPAIYLVCLRFIFLFHKMALTMPSQVILRIRGNIHTVSSRTSNI